MLPVDDIPFRDADDLVRVQRILRELQVGCAVVEVGNDLSRELAPVPEVQQDRLVILRDCPGRQQDFAEQCVPAETAGHTG